MKNFSGEGAEKNELDKSFIKEIVNLIIYEALKSKAAHIHIEPAFLDMSVRYKIDGVLKEVMSYPGGIQDPVISFIKNMADINPSEKVMPQDGKVSIVYEDKEYEIRVSTLPTIQGEKLFMNIRSKENLLLGIDRLGLTEKMKKLFKNLISTPHGLIIFSGPPGSGVTTTLYNSLNMLMGKERRICIIDKDCDYNLEGIKNVQVKGEGKPSVSKVLNDAVHKTFDTIVIGEIKEKEVLKTALGAAIAKHLVLSTIKAEDTADVINHLIDMEIEPDVLASGISGIVSQRLVRKICPRCREVYEPPKKIIKDLGFTGNDIFYKGRGCNNCKNTGYKGKCGVYEIMTLNDTLRSLIHRNSPSPVIKDSAVSNGMITLKKDCLNKVLEGITTIEEYFRVFAPLKFKIPV